MPEEEFLTKAKYDEFTKELQDLNTAGRKAVAEELEYAKSLGDLSENAEYHEAREKQGKMEDRIAHLESLMKYAKIVPNKSNTDEISVGSVVEVENLSNKKAGKQTFTIVGSEESDSVGGKISNKSPLGVALFGKKKGETFSFTTPGGEVQYKVKKIS